MVGAAGSAGGGEPAGAAATRRDRVRLAGAVSPASATVVAATAAAVSAASADGSAAGPGLPAGAAAVRRDLVFFTGAAAGASTGESVAGVSISA
jgi:hypothetical protein